MASDDHSDDEDDVYEDSQEDTTLTTDVETCEYEEEENADSNGYCQIVKGTNSQNLTNCQVLRSDIHCQITKPVNQEQETEAESAEELNYEEDDDDKPSNRSRAGRRSTFEKSVKLEIAERTSKSIRIFVPYPTENLLACPLCNNAKSKMGGGAEANKYITRHLASHHNLISKITFQCGLCLEKPPPTSAGNARWVNTHLKDKHDWKSDLKTPTTTRKRMIDTLNSAAPSLVKKQKTNTVKRFPVLKNLETSPIPSPIHRPTTRSMTKNSGYKADKELVSKPSALKTVNEETPVRKLAPMFKKRMEQTNKIAPAVTKEKADTKVITLEDEEETDNNTTNITPTAKRFNSYCLIHHSGTEAWLDSETIYKYIEWNIESATNCSQIDPLVFSIVDAIKDPTEAAEELKRYITKDHINIMAMCISTSGNKKKPDHWTLILITNQEYKYYDPLGSGIPEKLNKIMEALGKRHIPFDTTPPRQKDTFNCGVYVSLVAKAFVANNTKWFELTDVYEFRENMIAELRRRGYTLFNESFPDHSSNKKAAKQEAPDSIVNECDSMEEEDASTHKSSPVTNIDEPLAEQEAMEIDDDPTLVNESPKSVKKKPVMIRVMVHPDYIENLGNNEVKAALKRIGIICINKPTQINGKMRIPVHKHNSSNVTKSQSNTTISYRDVVAKDIKKSSIKEVTKPVNKISGCNNNNQLKKDEDDGWTKIKAKSKTSNIPDRILPPKLTDIQLKRYNPHQKRKKQDEKINRKPTQPTKNVAPKSVDQLMSDTREWFKSKMNYYQDNGRKFPYFEWLSHQLMAIINKAEAGDAGKVAQMMKREPPLNTIPGEMATQTENITRIDRRKKTDIKKNEEHIKDLYFKNRGKAFNRIVRSENKQCEIPSDKLETYFKSTMPDKTVSDYDLQELTETLPSLDVKDEIVNDFNAEEVRKYLETTKDTKPGTDGVVYSHLKHFDRDGELLASLYNECLHHQQIPRKWKQSETILLYKAGDESKAENWRPISLIDCVYKVYSGLLNNRIKQTAGLLSKCQRGFQERNGCNESIGILRTAIDASTSLNRNISVAWLDLQNAFGSVPHQLIQWSLKSFGFPSKLINIIGDFYAGSTMVVKSKNGLTNPIPITAGVKQGDCISPTLFNICLEPIIRRHLDRARGHKLLSTNVKLLCFADDMAIICNDKAQLQEELNSLDKDCRRLNLIFKPPKCASLIITRGEVEPNEKIYINNQSIRCLSQNTTYKYLGVPTGATGRCTETQRLVEVTQQMDKVNQSELAPFQKLDALKCFILPQLTHMFANSTPKLTDLRVFTGMVIKAAKTFHNIPISGSPREYVEVRVSAGGLGLASPTNTCLIQFLSSTLSKLWSDDRYVRTVYNNFLTRLTEKHTGKRNVTTQDKVDFLNNKKGLASQKSFNIFSRLREIPKVLSLIKGSPLHTMEYVSDGDDIAIRIKATEKSDDVYITKNEPKKLTKIIKNVIDRALTLNFINSKDVKSRVFQVVQQHPQSNAFVRKGRNISIAAHKFVHTARLNLLVCNGNNYDKTKSRRCRRCHYDVESQMHILQNCKFNMAYGITRRHDEVLDRVVHEIEKGSKNGYEIRIDRETGIHRDRPDIALRSPDGKSVLLADVTIAYENGLKGMQQAWDNKVQKYQHLIQYYKRMNIKAKILPLVFGSLGTYWKPTTESLRELGIPTGAIRNMIPAVCSGILEASKNCYWRHIFGESYSEHKNVKEDVQRRRDYWRQKNDRKVVGSQESRPSNN